jgi:hypothetical protein
MTAKATSCLPPRKRLPLGTATILQMVGGLGVLLALVNAVLLCEIHQVIESNCLGMTQFYVLTNQRLLFWSTC